MPDKITYGSTDTNDPNYDPQLAEIMRDTEGKPGTRMAAINAYSLSKTLREVMAAADSKADTTKKLSYPNDDEIMDLCRKLKNRAETEQIMDICRDFAGGDEKRAQSLARQARKYRHIWDG